ncbi:TonB-dependent receptor plug domain-containing protein, partial [Bacteroides fragilis]
RLKMAIAASIMLWCATPQQATADTNEEHAIEAVQQAKVKVKGTVVDETGEPMIGVAVKVLANNTGTITDLEGKFSVEAPLGGAIQISFIGYKTVTVKASSEPISVTLKEDSQQLDEVVVVGYGSQKKVNVTGSVSMVDSKVIESRPVQNVSQALQGVVPGLNMSVGNSGGALDSSLSINIRGAGTIGEGSSGSPLVLIDGIEGDMNTVNPNDIENISVLKDAASSSIYGARASFGVIMITTKSGKSGKTRVNYSGNVRFS